MTELERLRLDYNALQHQQDRCEDRGDNQESLDARELRLDALAAKIKELESQQ